VSTWVNLTNLSCAIWDWDKKKLNKKRQKKKPKLNQ
jgi:hypothetical protein